MRFGALCALVIQVLTSAGCGYSLAGRGSFLPDYIRAIGVPTFANRTTVFSVETQLTDKVRAEFIGRGRYRIVPDATGVDAVLTGEVTGVSIIPISTDPTTNLPTRNAITMSARVQLMDVRENKVLWENPSVVFRQESEQTSTGPAGDAAAFFTQDVNALDRMTTEFARTIVSAILEAF
jgi:Lipopolysaccharide-assembly